MVEIERNMFYKRQEIAGSGAVKLNAMYKDLAEPETDILTLGGGPKMNRFVLSGQSAPTPKYGDSTLKFGRFVTYVSGSDLSETAKLPAVDLYVAKKGTEILEGGMNLMTGGENLMVIASWVDSDIPWLEENFDGSDKSLGEVNISASGPVGTTVSDKTFAGGGSFLNFGEDLDGPDLMKKYFAENPGEDKIPVRPLNKSKINGFWIPRHDHRSGLKKATVFRPIWKMRDLKGVLNFERSTNTATDIEGAQTANPGNTIFNSFTKTADIQTAYTSGPDTTSPWCMSTMELSNEMVDSGGQSLKMYHLWAYNSGTCYDASATGTSSATAIGKLTDSGLEFGDPGSVNAQFCRATMTDIPFPTVLEQGTSTYMPSQLDSRVSLPEINIKFAINKMDKAVRVTTRGTGSADGEPNQYKYYNFASGATLSGNMAFHTLGRSFTVTFSNYPPEEGDSLDDFLYKTMTSTSPTNQTVGGFTCMRFIREEGQSSVIEAATDFDDKGQLFTVMPLNVVPSAMASNHTTGTANLCTNTHAEIIYGFKAQLDASSPSTGQNVYREQMKCIGVPYKPSYAWIDGNVTYDYKYEKAIPLSMGKFVNAKMVFDVMQWQYKYGEDTKNGDAIASPWTGTGIYNTRWRSPRAPNVSGAAGQDDGAAGEGTPFLRVFFTEGYEHIKDSDGLTDSEPPSIDIPFYQPSNDGDSPNQNAHGWFWGDEGYTGTDKVTKWPSCMTIWLQNYRYVKNTEQLISARGKNKASLADDNTIAASLPSVGFGSDYPLPTDYSGTSTTIGESIASQGVAREAEVYVDSITFNNWNNEMQNCSSQASTATSLIPIRAHANRTAQGGLGATNQNITTVFSDTYTPTYICLGFENGVTDMPLSNPNKDYEAYLLLNGFSSQGFTSLARQNISGTTGGGTVKMWPSVTSGSIDQTVIGLNSTGMWGTSWGRTSSPVTTGTMASTIDRGNANYKMVAQQSSNSIIASGAANVANMGVGLGSLSGTSAGSTSLSSDALTSKGTMQLYLGPHSLANTVEADVYWVKRENHMCAAKVTGWVEGDNNAITVDNPAIFDMPLDSTHYIIYQYGQVFTDSDGTDITLSARYQRGYGVEVIKQAKKRDGNIIYLESFDDAAMATPGASIVSPSSTSTTCLNPASLPNVYISPKKYWINLMMYPGSDSSSPFSGSNSSGKTYDGVCILSGTGLAGAGEQDYSSLTGSTYNESTYYYDYDTAETPGKSAYYGKTWILDPDAESNIETSIDFGHGAWDDEKQTGGLVDFKVAYPDSPLELDVTPVIEGMGLTDDDDILVTMSLHSPAQNQTITMYGNDWTGSNDTADALGYYSYESQIVKPAFVWGYEDPLPKVSNFKVQPEFDLLNKETNLYELTSEDLNAVTFTWDEEGDDIWYRMIYVDDKFITDKYHGAVFHAPLNETPKEMPGYPNYMTNANANTYYYGLSNTDTSLSNSSTFDRESKSGTGSNIITSIEGFAGYGQYFSGDAAENYFETGINHVGTAVSGCSQATIVTHIIPSDNSDVATSGQYIWSIVIGAPAAADRTSLYIDDNNKFNFYVSGTTLQSRNAFEIDGERPFTVGITFNKDRTFDNWKMYVNGVLEDTSAEDWDQGDTWNVNASSDMVLGMKGNGSTEDDIVHAYKGFIEEIVIYNREYFFPPEDQQFTLDTSYLKDAGTVYNHFPSGAGDNYQSAKVFIFDYHNIRGRSPKEVATTSQTSWKVTTV
mgnify:CR=1 FL=1